MIAALAACGAEKKPADAVPPNPKSEVKTTETPATKAEEKPSENPADLPEKKSEEKQPDSEAKQPDTEEKKAVSPAPEKTVAPPAPENAAEGKKPEEKKPEHHSASQFEFKKPTLVVNYSKFQNASLTIGSVPLKAPETHPLPEEKPALGKVQPAYT